MIVEDMCDLPHGKHYNYFYVVHAIYWQCEKNKIKITTYEDSPKTELKCRPIEAVISYPILEIRFVMEQHIVHKSTHK